MKKETSTEGLMGYLETFSGLKTFKERNPEAISPLVTIGKKILRAKEKEIVEIRWPVFVLLCRKPKV